MFDIYLDDTADEPQNFVGFGGFAGKRETWELVEEDFRIANEKHCISYFHAKHYPQLVPEYASMVLKRELFFFGVSVDYNAYKEFSTKRIKDNFGENEWVSCAGYLFQLIAETLPLGEDAAIVLDCRSPYSSSIYEQWERKASYSVNSHQLLSLSVISESADREKYPLLQVADLGANLLCRHVRSAHYGSSEPDLIQSFDEKQRCRGMSHLDKESIYALAAYLTQPVV